jgi:sugar phosphate isomerase/epimerase
MKLGFLTACLPGLSLTDIATWAAQEEYQTLEVAVWPATGGRDFEASHLSVAAFTDDDEQATRELLSRTGLEISSLAYYENNLHPDPATRAAIRTHLKRAIDVAARLGVESVGTFIGRDPKLSVAENLREGEKILPELVAYATERGVKIVIENCVMEGWHPDGYPGNLAYSPELWEWMFELGFYLNWDPSHLTWIGVDPLATIEPYLDRIVHTQAKDVETFAGKRNRFGFFGTVDKGGNPWEMGWWQYRVPGLGEVDWRSIIDRFHELGYAGTVSVEHEDPVWSGTPEKVKQGLRIAHRTLRPLIPQP